MNSNRENVSRLSIRLDKRFQELDTDTQTIMDNLLQTRVLQTEDLRRHFEGLSESQKREHAKTRAAFVYMDGEKRKARVELYFLESLRFRMMKDRYEKLSRNHEKTFMWIFESPQVHQKPWDNFVLWLRGDVRNYWIQGKAASGKSTLMRFIWDNPLTLQNLRTWSVGAELIVGSFFFFISGVEEQRSQRGLLRSLLYEVLKNRRHLIPNVFPEEWESKSALAAHDLDLDPESWTLFQLQKAFQNLIGLASPELKYCFFIDGLDEYEGPSEDIAQYFEDLSRDSVHVKFCISSRPWPVFQDIYHDTPGLRLQDLTKEDIKLYISDKLEGTKYMKQLLVEEPREAASLTTEILEKAAGVFLWVVLIVKSLVTGIRNGDGMSHLRSRLDNLPSDLETLFEYMLKSIDPLYMEEAAQIFQIFRASRHTLDLATLERALRFPDYRQAIKLQTFCAKLTDEDTARLEVFLERVAMRVNSRCKGLLELSDNQNLPASDAKFPMEYKEPPTVMAWTQSYPGSKSNSPRHDRDLIHAPYADVSHPRYISYLHRTVRDYLEQPDIWKKLVLRTPQNGFEPKTALLMSYVIGVKTTGCLMFSNTDHLFRKGETLLQMARDLEPLASEPNIALLEDLDRVITTHWTGEGSEANKGHWSNSDPTWNYSPGGMNPDDMKREWQCDLLFIAIRHKISWYIDAKLATLAPLASMNRRGLPLLAYVLCFDLWAVTPTQANLWAQKNVPARLPVPDCLMVEKILRYGANPNELYKGYTVWQYTIHYVHILNGMDKIAPPYPVWLKIFQLMLDYGADPAAYWPEDETTTARHTILQKAGGVGYSLKPVPPYVHYEMPPHIWLPNPEAQIEGSISSINDRLHHSVVEIINDVFVKRGTPEVEKLIKLLGEKKSAVGTSYKERKHRSESRKKRKRK
jgi:hypothetical protein